MERHSNTLGAHRKNKKYHWLAQCKWYECISFTDRARNHILPDDIFVINRKILDALLRSPAPHTLKESCLQK